MTLIKEVSEHKYAVKSGVNGKIGIDLNVASHAKMAAFSLIAGPHGISSFSGIKINLLRKKSHHVSYSMIGYLCIKYEVF